MIQEKCSIAIIDDDPIHRKLLQKILAQEGFSVLFEAENGIECIEEMEKRDKMPMTTLPNMIILDMEMPLMNGLQTASAIKQRWKNVKIIVNSASVDQFAIDQIMNNGGDFFVEKLLMRKNNLLINTIRDLL